MIGSKKDIKFLKNMIVADGKKARVWYSGGKLYDHPEGTITIYAKDYGDQLPSILKPKNDSDMMTDYFDKDKARILPSDPFYPEVKKRFLESEEKARKKYANYLKKNGVF